jgi:hypothetical protein
MQEVLIAQVCGTLPPHNACRPTGSPTTAQRAGVFKTWVGQATTRCDVVRVYICVCVDVCVCARMQL